MKKKTTSDFYKARTQEKSEGRCSGWLDGTKKFEQVPQISTCFDVIPVYPITTSGWCWNDRR